MSVDTHHRADAASTGRPDGPDPIRVRLARHAVGIVVLAGAAAAMGVLGGFPGGVPWWGPSATLMAGSVVIAATYTTNPGAAPDDVTRRAAVQSVVLAAVTYGTGWGFALPFVHLFGIADNINESGTDAGRRSLRWGVGVTIAAQFGVEAGLVPLASISVRGSHLVAGVTLVLLVLVTRRLMTVAQEAERARQALVSSERRFRTLVEDSGDVVLLLDDQLQIGYASPSIRRVLGRHEDRLVGGSFLDLVAPGDAARVRATLASVLAGEGAESLIALRCVRADDESAPFQVSHRDLRGDPDVGALVVSLRDLSERVRLEAQVEHGRTHDTVTGLPTRPALAESLAALMAASGPGGIGVFVIGLTGLAGIDGAAGRDATDDVLRGIAGNLTRSLRDGHRLARVGDDRFTIVVEGIDTEEGLRAVAGRLRSVVDRTPVSSAGLVRVRGIVGVATGAAGTTADEVLQAAELAQRAAVDLPDGVAMFDDSMHERLLARLTVERELSRAVRRRELVLHYQPLVRLGATAGDDDSLAGVEALVRWQHPERGLLAPGLFIPVAEETGLVAEIGWWVLDEAVAQLARWDAELGVGTVGYVSVNVSMMQFTSGELVDRIDRTLSRHGIVAERLLLELTETTLADELDTTRVQLAGLAGRGVQLAIDDFGTGYSSMAYLQQFPVDVLKIDRAFVSRAAESHRPELLGSLRQLAEALGLRTVAEGIETELELAAVRDLRFDVGQGYLLGRPVPADAVADRVRGARSRA